MNYILHTCAPLQYDSNCGAFVYVRIILTADKTDQSPRFSINNQDNSGWQKDTVLELIQSPVMHGMETERKLLCLLTTMKFIFISEWIQNGNL
ncbi:hypothetical protein L9F63_001710 [Diploptera punctata]|uniref:Uncharacterized protein n=1 Tax=Diploptera punctata TaxID=6984 RepID=A0AAD8A3H8_DIPPU|nr:hypothetical protein L9F63_001710 [Diploptera punctata]